MGTGAGSHDFGNTYGARKRIFTPIQFKGSVKVNGMERDVSRRVYQRNDIDFNYYDSEEGMTNLQRMMEGYAPIGKDGKPIELHHVLQKEAGPMVEIHELTHREYQKQLHGLRGYGESFRNDKTLSRQYSSFRRFYWKWRANEFIRRVQ